MRTFPNSTPLINNGLVSMARAVSTVQGIIALHNPFSFSRSFQTQTVQVAAPVVVRIQVLRLRVCTSLGSEIHSQISSPMASMEARSTKP